MNIRLNYLRLENIEFINNDNFNEILTLVTEEDFKDVEIVMEFKKRWIKIINSINNSVEGIQNYDMSFFELIKSKIRTDIELNPSISTNERTKCHLELETIHCRLKKAVKQAKNRYRKKIYGRYIKIFQKQLMQHFSLKLN
ncbi:hypothetical protein Mevan_0167 [Methanococcus vannielii SB]|uniref:Uncharacterized protein n=1 Tax=Methanococcus vannielii (strain ATCC 35089 / DSM 1224 / JCM 13029 / OCM 148 / SB) TaxID=406327 RepID=A6UNK6_METVS|nr:hypothetical protein [Methanococcus vannielii]ABR54078.1 hypothetical protein Mevan_0167 [Methanococcus vannielii SB]